MARHIQLTVDDDLSDDQYADLANAVWMLLRNLRYNFHIKHDEKTSAVVLDGAWDAVRERRSVGVNDGT